MSAALKSHLTVKPTRFDALVLVVIAALAGAILLTVLLGDHVGVLLQRVSPTGLARSTHWITIQFSEEMDRDSVAGHLRLEPPVEGETSWSGHTMIFHPTQAMMSGAEYTVILAAGAESRSGRRVLDEHRFRFTVRSPRVAYLAPADGVPQNIWIVDPLDPDHPQKVTFSTSGIFNFDISPDGSQVAYAEHNSETGGQDIKLLDLESGAVQQITNCVDGECTTPVWRPDGRMIAYERIDYNSELSLGISPTRVWLLDLTTSPPATRPLFSDSQSLGYGPQWSADGNRIAVYDTNSQGILVYDFAQNDIALIPTRYGITGTFSPDGTRMIFPEVTLTEQGSHTVLQIADLETRRVSSLTRPDEPVDDDRGVWHPDGQVVAVARRYLDNRYTSGRQIYLLHVEDGSAEPLVVEENYYNGFFVWDPTGAQLVIQRFPQPPPNEQASTRIRPEIWTYTLDGGEMTRVAVNAFHPRWVP